VRKGQLSTTSSYAIARNTRKRLFKGLFFYFVAALFTRSRSSCSRSPS
jgi:hypothetical protein